MLVGDREHACFTSESCGIFPREHSVRLEPNSVEVRKNPDHEMGKEQIFSGICEDPD